MLKQRSKGTDQIDKCKMQGKNDVQKQPNMKSYARFYQNAGTYPPKYNTPFIKNTYL